MSRINVLDSTLRDGGYINNWEFGSLTIPKIIDELNNANVDFIECGFMSDEPYNPEKTIFHSLEDINYMLPKFVNKSKVLGMITYGEYDQNRLTKKTSDSIAGFRVIFKKNQWQDALEYCKEIKEKGWLLFINPTFTDQYSDTEILQLISEVNKIKPDYLSIVDSMGVMRKIDIIRFFSLIDHNLDKEIGICFHSHNNLQLSFANAQIILEMHHERSIVIDSSVFGMGRGAGNLCTELLMQYLNENNGKSYDILSILKIIDRYIMPIFLTNPWGYSVPYYLAAIHNCHPNYAAHLFNKQTLNLIDISKIIEKIDSTKKGIYNKNYAEDLYLQYMKQNIDDSKMLESIQSSVFEKPILIIAPGKSIVSKKNIILSFIEENNPIVFSTNFIPDTIPINYLFLSNLKRFENLNDVNKVISGTQKIIVTSNVSIEPAESILIANYGNYINDNPFISDNSVLMLISLLKRCGVKKITFAGFDGFVINRFDNYYDKKFVNVAENSKVLRKNEEIQKELIKLSNNIDINFLTESKYEWRD